MALAKPDAEALVESRRAERRARRKALGTRIAATPVIGPAYGLAKGLSVTLRTMMRRSVTAQYPHEVPNLPARTRGVIALKSENCTICMLCARECPDWCIYIDSHKELMPPKTPGARPRTRNMLDRFAIDFALCMYCGICVEVCPFDALFWAPNFEYSESEIGNLTHEMETLGTWVNYVLPPPELEEGAQPPKEASAEAKVYAPPVPALGAPASPKVPAPTAPVVAAPAPAPTSAAGPAPPPAPAPVAAPAGGAREAPDMDEEVFKREIAAGKSEREARAIAKKAAVLKRKQAVVPAEAVAPATPPTPVEPAAPAAAPPSPPAAAPPSDHDAPDIDEEVYQRELAAGKPERVARAMAKKAAVIRRKQQGG